MQTRRSVLAASAVAATGGIAGCTGGTSDSSDEEGDPDGESADGRAEFGVAAEWNAIRARTADGVALGIAGEFSTGAAVVGDVLARFEGATDEWGTHEQLEETDHEAYEEFEEALEELRLDGLEAASLDRARTEAEIADDQLRSAQRETLIHRNAIAFDMGLFAARVADVAMLAAAGAFGAAETVADGTADRWEESIVHDEVSTAEPDLYATVEGGLGALATAAADEDPGAVRDEAETAMTAAFDASYVLAEDEAAADAAQLAAMQARGWDAAVLDRLGGVDPETAADVVRETYQRFESARVHESLETADHDTYEAFEGKLEAYIDALADGEGVDEAAAAFADAAERAGFAVAGALEVAPGDGGGDHGHGHEYEDLEGGPNVVEGVPDDADRVVEIGAASFEPEELTIDAGETVAFEHVEGEPHTVTAYEDGIPADAAYWASGSFESESAARDGWDEGQGAVLPGQAYVRSFEVEGSHRFCCIPHEAAGQTGRIVVE